MIGEPADASPLTEPGSPAGESLSTSADGGQSDQSSPGEGGSIETAPDVDPYTDLVGKEMLPNPYIGQDVDFYTNLPFDDTNANAFTGGQDVDVSTSPPGGGLLGSPDLSASNGPIQSSGPQLTAEQVGVLLVGATPVGQVIVGGATYSQSLINVGGVPTYLYYSDRPTTWWTEPAPATATQTTPTQPASPASSPAAPAAPAAPATPIVPTAAPAPAPSTAQRPGAVGTNNMPAGLPGPPPTVTNPPTDWTTETEWSFQTPDRRLIPSVTHYDSGNRALNFVLNKVVLPWRNALAFVENVPLAMLIGVDDALKHSPFEMEYRAAQDMMPLEGAMGLTMEIGPALDYAATWLSTSPEVRSAVTAPVFWFTGVGGGGGSVPGRLGRPAALNAAAELPALAPELAANLPAGVTDSGVAYESIAEEAASVFQDRVRQAELILRSNPELITQLGGRHTGGPVSIGQLSAAARKYEAGQPGFARALGGNAMEALVNRLNKVAPPSAGWFRQVGGPNRIDFVGEGVYKDLTFELTTEAGVPSHSIRPYMQETGAMIFTYTLPF
jgi:hypothetical protein